MVAGRETQPGGQWVQGYAGKAPQAAVDGTALQGKAALVDPLGHPHSCQCTEMAWPSHSLVGCYKVRILPIQGPPGRMSQSQSLDLFVPGVWGPLSHQPCPFSGLAPRGAFGQCQPRPELHLASCPLGPLGATVPSQFLQLAQSLALGLFPLLP